MLLNKLTLSALAGSLLFAAGLAQAADQIQDQTRDQLKDQTQDQLQDQTRDRTRLQDQIYGSQLMTAQEREQYRAQMLNLKSEKEREAYRLEHHKRMQQRAKERGVTLPDEPPMRPGSVGPGGAGPGGMGSGGKR